MSPRCHKCSAQWPKRQAPGRRDRCPRCGADMRCCLNCRNYDQHVAEQCRERDADPVTNKERANFCEFYSPRRDGGGSQGTGNQNKPSGEDPTQKLKDILGI